MSSLPLLAALLPALYASASFGSLDGVLALEEFPGWETRHAEAPAVMSLRRGTARMSAAPADDEADLASIVLRAAREASPHDRPGVARDVSAGGLPFALASRPVGGVLFAAVAVDRVRYLFEFRGAKRAEARDLLGSLHRQGEPPPEAPGPAPYAAADDGLRAAEAAYYEGAVRLPAPASGRLTPRPDGWVVGSMATWRVGVSESEVAPLSDGPREAAEASIRRRAELLTKSRRCTGADVLDHPLANGWTVLEMPFACPDSPPGSVAFVGAVARDGGRPLDLAGDYASPADFDAILGWLGTAKDTAAGHRAAAPEGPPAERGPRGPAVTLALSALALAGLALLARRQRAP